MFRRPKMRKLWLSFTIRIWVSKLHCMLHPLHGEKWWLFEEYRKRRLIAPHHHRRILVGNINSEGDLLATHVIMFWAVSVGTSSFVNPAGVRFWFVCFARWCLYWPVLVQWIFCMLQMGLIVRSISIWRHCSRRLSIPSLCCHIQGVYLWFVYSVL